MGVVKEVINKVFYGAHGESIRYLFFGFLNVVITWVTYAILVLAGMNPNLANIFSWIIGVSFAFVMNKLYVFNSNDWGKKEVSVEATVFTMSRVMTGVIAIFGFPILYELGMNQAFMGVDGFLAKITVSVIEIALNYAFSKYLVFKK